MQRDAAIGRKGLLHRQPGELVPERHRIGLRGDHPRRQALLEVTELGGGERLEEPDFGLRRRDGDRLEEQPRGLRKVRDPREHRVAHGARYLAGAGREHLGDEERVAPRLAVQVVGVDPVRLGEGRDGIGGERRYLEPADRAGGRELAEDEGQRVGAIELVVAVAGEDERGNGLHLARQ